MAENDSFPIDLGSDAPQDDSVVESTNENEPKILGHQDLYNVNDGIHGRSGGPYLDEVEALAFERLQAAREGSEPNFDKPRPGPGIVLVSEQRLVSGYNPTLIAGDDRRNGDVQARPYATDVPIVAATGPDFSFTDENRGDVEDEVVGVLEDNPAEDDNVSAEFAKSGL